MVFIKTSYKQFYLLTIILLAVFYQNKSYAQDLHFSKFFNSPLSINPANTGFIPDADYRIGAHFRNQFSNIMLSPYKTVSFFGDAQLLRDKLENGWIGIGGLMLSDVAGSGSLQSTKLYLSTAYHQMIANSSLVSLGFNLGWVNKRINPSNLKFPDQFDGHFFDNTLPTAVVFSANSVNYFDLQTGLNYAYFPNDNTYINAGYSIHHVNQPKESFFEDQTANGKIPMRHIAFINAIVKLNNQIIIRPNLFYNNQNRSSELTIGTLMNVKLSEFGEKQLIAGCYYRLNDAIIPMAGFHLGQFEFTFSYDATVSSLKNFNHTSGATEFSIIKKGSYPKSSNRQSLCPTF
jgi:type IX secretion system PorP/SprF family membrane protein